MSGHPHGSLTATVHHLLAHTSGATHLFVKAALLAACVGCAWLVWTPLQPLLVRLWYGRWSFHVESGEWRRVTGRDPYGELLDAKTQLQRRGEAAHYRKERGEKAIAAIIMGVVGFLILRDWWTGAAVFHRWFGTGPFCWTMELIGVCCAVAGIVAGLFWLLGSSVAELAFQANFQGMTGARVFDPAPVPPPGPELLGQQMGHGEAGPASPVSIHDALSGNRRGEPATIWDE